MSGWPLHWERKARSLHRACQLLYPAVEGEFQEVRDLARHLKSKPEASVPEAPPSVFDVFFFLAALAAENLLKGLLVHQDPSVISSGKLRGKLVTSHDLEAIADELGIDVSPSEREFLALSRSCICSWGRYPVSRSKDGLDAERRISWALADVYARLFDRLSQELRDRPVPRRRKEQHDAAQDGECVAVPSPPVS